MISKRAYMYCREDLSLIENYDKAINDSTQIWRCHHRLEIQDEGKIIYTSKQLENLGLYYNRPASELIFLTLSEHNYLHAKYTSKEKRDKFTSSMRGKSPTAEHRKHLSEALKGRRMSEEEKACHKKHWEEQKGKSFSKEIREKMSKSHKENFTQEMREEVSKRFKGVPKSEETKRRMSESAKRRISEDKNYASKQSESIKNSERYQQAMAKRKGEKFWNNGVIQIRALECPEGFVRGKLPFSEEYRKNISAAVKGKRWWNNGVICKRALECPEGFVPGRLKK